MQLVNCTNGEALTETLRNKEWRERRIEVRDTERDVLIASTTVSCMVVDEGTRKGLLFKVSGMKPRILSELTNELDRNRCHQLRRSALTVYLERDNRPSQTALFAEFRPGECKRSTDTVLMRLDRAIQRVLREELRKQRTARGLRPRPILALVN